MASLVLNLAISEINPATYNPRKIDEESFKGLCESLKKFGMELDPHYCSVIIKRWQDYSGQTAVKVKN